MQTGNVLSFYQVASAYVFVLFILVGMRIAGIPKERELGVASLRMTLQLVLMAHVLAYLFSHPHPLASIVTIVVMEVFAYWNVCRRLKQKIPRSMQQAIALAMWGGSSLILAILTGAMAKSTPWYAPRTLIPLAGMMIGNAMMGLALAAERLADDMTHRKAEVEGALMCGATPYVACRDILSSVWQTALTPVMQSMMGMGIVFLPGMMTGQIISGASPMAAIGYQIVAMLGILGSVALVVAIFLGRAYQVYFTKDAQWREDTYSGWQG